MGISYKLKLEKLFNYEQGSKKNYIEKMSSDIDKSEAVIVTHYQGLNMPQLRSTKKTNERAWYII